MQQQDESHQDKHNFSSSKTKERRGHGTNSTISNQLINYYILDTSKHVRADEPGTKIKKQK